VRDAVLTVGQFVYFFSQLRVRLFSFLSAFLKRQNFIKLRKLSEMYQLQTRISDILNYPLAERISQLRYCIGTAPIKDLQAFYPTLVSSIFGVNQNHLGWGLRTITTASPEYYLLYSFFNPHEAFFHLIYRLQSCGFVNKYEIPFPDLPPGFRSMLESARVDGFYTKLISTEHFQPKMLSLSEFSIDIISFHENNL
jgi:hypothetical protein